MIQGRDGEKTEPGHGEAWRLEPGQREGSGPGRPGPTALATRARRQDAQRPGGAAPGGRTRPGCPTRPWLEGRPDIKTMIRPGHGVMLQMHHWLAELRDGASADPARPGSAERPGPGYAVPASYSYGVRTGPGRAEPAGHARAMAGGPGYAVPAGYGRAEPPGGGARPEALAGPVAPAAPARAAVPAVPAGPAAWAAPAGPAGAAVRAVIGDQLRLPVMWCEMGSCASWHADPAALGEADARARAVDAGWRIDALGRLACPRCQQTSPGFRTSSQDVPRDRHTAAARTARASRAALRSSRDLCRAASGYPPARRAEPERDRHFPAARAVSAGRRAERPASASIPAVRC